jgi:hypothetical protein
MTQAAALKYMKRVDTREIPHGTNEIRSFVVVRNEKLRLPSTLRHHRSLGVRRFFALDNGSTDGTLDYLCGEPDVHVFSTSSSYAESNYGLTWTNELLNAFGSGHWTLTIDADEQFIFPHYEGITLPQFCGFLDSIGAEAVPCLLLDMYPGVAIRDATHDPIRPLLETCNYFDHAPTGCTGPISAPTLKSPAESANACSRRTGPNFAHQPLARCRWCDGNAECSSSAARTISAR